jgi:hypothetical protein
MADKFLNTGQGAVNLSNGTVNIIAAELGAVNLIPSKTLKTNATKQIVSADLDISDVTNLQSELSTKTELNFVESDTARVTPAAGELKLYAKSDNHLYKLDDTGDEKQLGNVFSTGTSLNHSLAVYQGGSGTHITDSVITYDPSTEELKNILGINTGNNSMLLLPSGMQLISPSLTINAVTDFYNNAISNIASVNGIVPANILQNNGTTPMTAAYVPTTAQDVATKTYVDTHSTSNNYLKIDGSSVMSGNLRLGNNNILGVYDIQTGTINGENITTMATDITTNQDSIFTNSLNITSVGGQATTNATAITTLQSGKVSKSGDTMTGDLNMLDHSILGAHIIQANVIDEVGSQIDINTGFLKVNGGQGDCELRICADENNNNEGYNPRIVFQQDGTDTPGAMWMGNNQLNISSATGAGGINFRTTSVADDWEGAPTRMSIDTDGITTVNSEFRIDTDNKLNLGYNTTKESNAGVIAYKRFSSSVDITGAGETDGGDRQVQIWEDLTLKAVIQTSDERLKHHIRPIEITMAGNLIDNLEPKCYMWKNIDSVTGEETEFKDHHCYMGLIAQEVKAVQDDIGDSMGEKLRISRNAKSEHDYMTVTYTQLIAPMLKCIQDLRTRVETLEQIIST